MNRLIRHLLNLSATTLTLCTLSLPALAEQIWQGTGRIIDGVGEGSTVELKIKVENNRITFLSGLSQNEQITVRQGNPLVGEAKTQAGTWQFLQTEERKLGVSLFQEDPYRLIQYILEP